MPIDYSKYTLNELLDVQEHIDKQNYPERYQALCDEIEKRKQNGEFERLQAGYAAYDAEHDYQEKNFVIEFSDEGSGVPRKLFIAGFLALNIILLWIIIGKYSVANLVDVHKYTTPLHSAICKVEKVTDSEGYTYKYYDLHVSSYQDTFSALDINKNKCQSLARKMATDSDISIWHRDGLIYQLKQDNRELLRYNYMKLKIRAMQTNDVMLYFLGLMLLWAIFTKSLINAFSPGTYASDD